MYKRVELKKCSAKKAADVEMGKEQRYNKGRGRGRIAEAAKRRSRAAKRSRDRTI